MSGRRFAAHRPLAGAAAAALLAGPVASAGTTTHVAPDTAPGVSTGTTVTTNGGDVTISGGTVKGGNLYDSFSSFNLGDGTVATWVETPGGSSIANVINRVTGGEPSTIDGTIVSNFPHAAFFFINPAGVAFGSGASVNVPAAAYFSTASSLRFRDGAVWSARTPKGSTLTVAAPASFGFLGGEGAVVLDGANLTLPDKLSLSGSNVFVSNATIQSGALDLVAIGGSAATLSLDSPLASGAFGGNLSLSGSQLATSPGAGSTGAINLGGSDLSIDGSLLGTASSNVADGGPLAIVARNLVVDDGAQILTGAAGDRAGGEITIVVGDKATLDDASIGTLTVGGRSGGDVIIRAGDLALNNFSSVFTNSESAGNAGAISIKTGNLLLGGFSEVASESDVTGDAGHITINATGDVGLYSGSSISDAVLGSGGVGGDIEIDASNVVLSEAGVNDDTYGSVNAGSINIRAKDVVLDDFAFVSSTSLDLGRTGAIRIFAADGITIDGDSIVGTTDFYGNTGDVALSAGNTISIHNNSGVETLTGGPGSGGVVTLSAGSLSVVGGSDGVAAIGAGNVTVDVSGNVLIEDGEIEGLGAGGTVTVNSGSLSALGGSAGFAEIGGQNVAVAVSGAMLVEDGAEIIASAGGDTPNAGDITVRAGTLTILSGPDQNGRATGIFSEDASLSNSAPTGGTVYVGVAGALLISGGEISSAGFNAGSGGDVTVIAKSIVATNTSYILSKYDTPDGAGHAGSILVEADTIDLSENSTIDSSANGVGGGNAGSVTVDAHSLLLQSGASIKTNSVAGDAGGVTIDFPTGGLLTIEGSSPAAPTEITTSSGTDKAGEITIEGPSAVILNGGEIVATGPFKGAHVDINSGALIESTDRPNTIDVTGVLVLDTDVVDVNQATARPDITFLDASKVLRGQCAALEASGETSNLVTHLTGPYVAPTGGQRVAALQRSAVACGPAPGPN